MSVGIVTTWFERGAAYVSRQIMDSLVCQGEKVYVFARGGDDARDDPKWNIDNVTWGIDKFSPMPTAIQRKVFEAWIVNNDIETIIFNEQQYWAPVLWAKELGVKVIAYVDYYTDITYKFFEVYDQLWCNTKRHASVFSWHNDCQYIPWGTNVDLFSPVENVEVDCGGVKFFTSSGMNPHRKGTDILIDALDEVYQLGFRDFKVIIHTQVDLGSLFPSVEGKIKKYTELGILNIITETVSAPGLYFKGDVYIYPSRLDGIGLTLAEALSCGLPVITTNEPPMNEFGNDKFCSHIDVLSRNKREDGYYWPLVNPDPSSLAKCMIEYLKSDNLAQKKIESRLYALDKLDWNLNSSCLSNLISNISATPASNDLYGKLIKYDERKYKCFHKYETFYRFLVFIYKKFKG